MYLHKCDEISIKKKTNPFEHARTDSTKVATVLQSNVYVNLI